MSNPVVIVIPKVELDLVQGSVKAVMRIRGPTEAEVKEWTQASSQK